MNLKKLFLVVISLLCLFTITSALIQSSSEPQFQAKLQLYQTDLILHTSELKTESLTTSNNENQDLKNISQALIGGNPYSVAKTQYQDVINLAENAQNKLQQEQLTTEVLASDTPRNKLKEDLITNQQLLQELKLKLGILNIKQDDINQAITTWKSVENNQTAVILTNLWSNPPQVLNNSLEVIENNLDGWFRYTALKRVYELDNNQNALLNLENEEQILAKKAISRLITLSIIPGLGGLIGFILILFLGIQLLLKKESSILSTNNGIKWDTPWDWEIIWQVFIVGFFFVSQIFLPLLFGFVGFNPVSFSIRGKALYVLATYLLMSGCGLAVLYYSIKPFFPLSKDWFNWKDNKWFLWGIGGYLTAIPCVFLVSFINQQLWDGQGGSNPLLFLALEAQDKVALAIFFFTASVAAPIFEEIMFRGFLLPSLTRYLPVWGAVLVSAFIFAIAHLSLSEILPLATLGIILGFVYSKSRNLLSSILIHSLWNGGTLFSLFVLGSNL
jgi:membrane protease YdiL (CAAX protease family)